MAPYDPYAEALTSPASPESHSTSPRSPRQGCPFREQFVPRDVVNLHHIQHPSDMPPDPGLGMPLQTDSWDGLGWYNHAWSAEASTLQPNKVSSSPRTSLSPGYTEAVAPTRAPMSHLICPICSQLANMDYCSCPSCHMRHHGYDELEKNNHCFCLDCHTAPDVSCSTRCHDMNARTQQASSPNIRSPHYLYNPKAYELPAASTVMKTRAGSLGETEVLIGAYSEAEVVKTVDATSTSTLSRRNDEDEICWSSGDYD